MKGSIFMNGPQKIVRIHGENRSEASFVPMPEARERKVDCGEIIKKHRLDLNISQKQLAKDLGYNANQVHFWETGISAPRLNMIVPLCNYLHIPLGELLGSDVNALSEDEQMLLKVFRSAPSEAQKATITMLSAMGK